MVVINTKQKPNFKGVPLPPVSQDEFDKYIDIYDKKYDKYNHGKTLDKVFKRYKSDKNVLGMYIKCIMLDKFYSTNIKFIDELVHHLVSIKDLHKRIRAGNLDVIYEMQKVKMPNDECIHYRSFVSKYCRRYNPKAYPIYDSIVKEVLEYYTNKKPTFYENKITSNDWLDYEKYVQIVDTFIKAHKFITSYATAQKMSPYVVFDRYLWTLGKEIEAGVNLIKSIREAANLNDTNALNKLRQKLNKPGATAPALEKEVEKKYFYYLSIVKKIKKQEKANSQPL